MKAYKILTIQDDSKGPKPKVEGKNSNDSEYLREKTWKPLVCLRILHPVAFYFKDEGVLATHPLRNHPQRVFGQ